MQRVGHLQIDLDSHRLLRDGAAVRLTRTEWALLRKLVANPNQVLTYRTLLQSVWGEMYGEENDYVHTYIRRLRLKLEEDPANPQYLQTEAGIGYRFNTDISPTENGLTTQTAPIRSQMINPLPQDVSERYVGRESEVHSITDLFSSGARMVSIYGRAGVGKTALACRAVLAARDQFDGIVCLSAPSTGIDLSRIFSDMLRLFPDPGSTDAIWQGQTAQRVVALLDKLRGGKYLLLLDNLEDKQGVTGELTDPDLETFLKVVLEQGGALHILATSRIPLALPRTAKTWERVIALEQGLAPEEGADLLRRCDPDGNAGLQDAPQEVLTALSAQAQGHPRALEALAGLLLEDPLLTPAALLQNESLFSGEIESVVVKEAIKRLDTDALRVMQALALCLTAVDITALETLLAGFIAPDALRGILNRLVRAYFCKFEKATGLFSLHPPDQQYCYAQIPAGSPTDRDAFTRFALHRRAADIFAEQQEPEAALLAAEHRVRAQEYEAAAALLVEENERLYRSGYYARLNDLYAAILPQVRGELAIRGALNRGEALRAIGHTWEAIDLYTQGMDQARETALWRDESYAHTRLGWGYYDLGRFEDAMGHWQQAYQILQDHDEPRQAGHSLGGLGWVSYLQGEYDQARDYFGQAIKTFGEVGDKLGIGVNLGDLGATYGAMGDTTQALRVLREALDISRSEHSLRDMSFQSGYLAVTLLWAGDLEAARAVVEEARKMDVPVNNPFIAALHGVILARLGERDHALIAFQYAVERATPLLQYNRGLYNVRYARGLAHAGVALLESDQPSVQAAIADYTHALALCSARGVTAYHLRLLDSLMRVQGGSRLAKVRDVLKSA